MKQLNRGDFLPWVVTSDLNEILTNDEKQGGQVYEFKYMHNFKYAFNKCGLEDLGLKAGNKPKQITELEGRICKKDLIGS